MESAATEKKTYYGVLGVKSDACFEEVKKAYRACVVAMHPDKGGNADDFHAVQEAWGTLKDMEKRSKYDAEMLADNVDTFRALGATVVELDEFEYEEIENIYLYPCRCGDEFMMTDDDVLDGVQILTCPSCSLLLNVSYDCVDSDEKEIIDLETAWQDELESMS
jgi:diphthamide biosynthesis protein 4|eukprot:g4188.t1